MSGKKYVLTGGYVRSLNDNQLHYVTTEELITLYGVSREQCITFYTEEDLRGLGAELHFLYPDSTGEYKI